jgi:hypothetical protein
MSEHIRYGGRQGLNEWCGPDTATLLTMLNWLRKLLRNSLTPIASAYFFSSLTNWVARETYQDEKEALRVR